MWWQTTLDLPVPVPVRRRRVLFRPIYDDADAAAEQPGAAGSSEEHGAAE